MGSAPRVLLLAFSTLLVLLVAFERDAGAIPAFARRYQTSCSTCHVQFPKLNPFGEAFRRNGYQLPDHGDEEGIKQDPIILVPEERKALFPFSDFPSDLAPSLPIAAVVTGLVPIFPDDATRPVGQAPISFDQMFAQASLIAGVRFFRDVAFFGGVNFLSNQGVQFERAFVVVSNLVGDGKLNVRVGQFEPQILEFSDYRRITGPTRWILNEAPRYGSFTLEPIVRGVDVSGILGGRFGYDLAWVQGVEGGYGLEPIRQMPRDGYAHAFVKIGGLRLDGIERPGAGRTDRWVQFGAFGYGGRHDVDADNAASTPPEPDVLVKAGFDVNAHAGMLDVLVAGAFERHDLQTSGVFERTQGLAEVTVQPLPWLVGIFRAEADAPDDANPKKRLTPMISVLPRINFKTQAYVQIVDDGVTPGGFRPVEIDIAATLAF